MSNAIKTECRFGVYEWEGKRFVEIDVPSSEWKFNKNVALTSNIEDCLNGLPPIWKAWNSPCLAISKHIMPTDNYKCLASGVLLMEVQL